MEEIYRARHGEGAWSFCTLSWQASHPALTRVHQLEAPQTQSFWVLMQASLNRHN